jgi:hypothetical protein
MKGKQVLVFALLLSGLVAGCSSGPQLPDKNERAAIKRAGEKSGDDAKGKGKFSDITLTHPLDQNMVAHGKNLADVKCTPCHKFTDEKLVGPGWKGVTNRRKPEWIMNFVTNTDEMIDKDPTAKALLEVCMVRMPNQHLNDDEARHVLEFMRHNDGNN